MKTEHYEINGCPVTVINMWSALDTCNMCDKEGVYTHCVPWYCGPVREGTEDAGYKVVCPECYHKWEKWNDKFVVKSS